MTTVHKVSAYILLALGILHTALTPLFYQQFDVDTLWFAGTGLGLIFLALLNFVALCSPVRIARGICLAANLTGLSYGILIVIVLPEPQSFLALISYLAVTVGSVFSLIRRDVAPHHVSS